MATLPTIPQPGDEITAPWGQAVAELLAKVVDPRFIQRGAGSLAMGSAAVANAAVTFPTPFVNAPMVIVNRTASTATAPKVHVWGYSATATGFTVGMGTGDATTSAATIGYTWIAIDPAYLAS